MASVILLVRQQESLAKPVPTFQLSHDLPPCTSLGGDEDENFPLATFAAASACISFLPGGRAAIGPLAAVSVCVNAFNVAARVGKLTARSIASLRRPSVSPAVSR